MNVHLGVEESGPRRWKSQFRTALIILDVDLEISADNTPTLDSRDWTNVPLCFDSAIVVGCVISYLSKHVLVPRGGAAFRVIFLRLYYHFLKSKSDRSTKDVRPCE